MKSRVMEQSICQSPTLNPLHLRKTEHLGLQQYHTVSLKPLFFCVLIHNPFKGFVNCELSFGAYFDA